MNQTAQDTKPIPTPVEFNEEDWTIEHRGAVVARVYNSDDFACLDTDAERDNVNCEQIVTGRKLSLAYNSHDALLEACESVLAHVEGMGLDTGMIKEFSDMRDAVAKARGES